MSGQEKVSTLPMLNSKEDWPIWKFLVGNNLKSSDVFGTVDGSNPRPVAGAAVDKVNAWNSKNVKAMDAIGRSLGSSYIQHVIKCTTAREMWTTLTGLCEVVDANNCHLLQQRFFDYRYQSGTPVQDYISKVKSLAADCVAAGGVISDTQIVSKIIHGLPSSFESIIYSFEARSEDQKGIDDITKVLLRKKLFDQSTNSFSQNKSGSSDQIPAMYHNSKKNKSNSKRRNGKFNGACRGCDQRGHKIKDCPYPASHQNSNQRHGNSNSFHKDGNRQQNVQRSAQNRLNPSHGVSSQGHNGHNNGQYRAQNGSRHLNYDNQMAHRNANVAEPETAHQDRVQVHAFLTSVCDKSEIWIGDSGAGEHMTSRRDWILNYNSLYDDEMVVVLGNGHSLPVAGIGQMKICTINAETFMVDRVLHVPKLKRNLFSLSEVTEKGYTVTLVQNSINVSMNDRIFLRGERVERGVYRMDFKPIRAVDVNSATITVSDSKLWHRRLGHANYKLIERVIKDRKLKSNVENQGIFPDNQ